MLDPCENLASKKTKHSAKLKMMLSLETGINGKMSVCILEVS